MWGGRAMVMKYIVVNGATDQKDCNCTVMSSLSLTSNSKVKQVQDYTNKKNIYF